MATGVSIGNERDCYVTGLTGGRLGESHLGEADAFLIKYDVGGDEQWTRQIGTKEWDWGNATVVDSEGNCYMTGGTRGNFAAPFAGGGDDAFLVKYDTDGGLLWKRQIGSFVVEGLGVAVDADDNCYVSGLMAGKPADYPHGRADAFIAKYDADGTQVWINKFAAGGSARARASSIAIANDGIIYVAGATTGDMGGENHGGKDAFILCLDADGERLWSEQLGTPLGEAATAITVDTDGSCYIAGCTDGDLGGDNMGKRDIFIARYDSNGAQQWLVQTGTVEDDVAFGLSLDNSGLYVTGHTDGALAADVHGGKDGFLMKYDRQGQALWKWQFGTPEGDEPRGISTDSDGNCYIVTITGAMASEETDAFIMALAPREDDSQEDISPNDNVANDSSGEQPVDRHDNDASE